MVVTYPDQLQLYRVIHKTFVGRCNLRANENIKIKDDYQFLFAFLVKFPF